ncbi:hypothetical protein B0T22DRAFT_475396 [Podospora appendiculata]|uniref:DUF7820 domain-containing protein n=1 Tax=Podospora appendiculata TaxID=314037 RepID=A0AAE1CFK8_9PEZI|nr:hypothetical protein B0T22DRAFT_475396 [Podospora appendiculata]
MDLTHDKSDEMERRISMRSSRRISVDGGDANDASDDDYGMVADGFRPMQPSHGTVPSIHTFPSPSTTAAATERSPSSSPSPAAGRPSSIAKPHRPHDSISLRHDGAMGPIHESTGPTRSSSISTTSSPYIPSDSPYQGPSGPSHPYQMYPQNVRLARTMSTATSSTAPVSEVSYAGPRGPTHPYGLYNQGTVADSAPLPVTSVPLGFHGLPDQYRRRIGPDGEDVADIIGPDGHTEQLPPYTRYPDDALPQKVVEAADPATPAVQGGAIIVPVTTAQALPTLTTVAPAIPGAGGLGLASRNPEFDSEEELGTPRSRHSSRSFNSDVSHHEINTAAAEMSEKRRPLTGWQAWMRRRVGGIIPYWAICLTALVLLLMGAILGSVIGTFMSQHRKPPRKDIYPDPMLPSATTTYDATAMATPTSLAPLPTGNFSMPLMVPTRSSNTCFNDTTQSKAWGCYFSPMTGMYMTIDKKGANQPGEYTFSLRCNQSLTLAANFYSYGEQPPQISQPLTLELVTDILEPTRGPAWFKMVPYNKTMILPEAVLSSTGSSSVSGRMIRDRAARDDDDSRNGGSRTGDFKRKGVAEQGDKPWICNWPGTYLEVFIYPDQNASPNPFGQPPSSSTSSSPSTSPQPTPPPSSGSTTSQSTASTSSTLDPDRQESVPPSSTPSSSSSYSKWDGAHGGYNNNNNNNNHGYEDHTVVARSAGPQPSTSAYPSNGSPLGEMPRPSYPKALKLEERRVYGAPMPQCTQVEIQGPGQPAKPVRDSNGNVVTIDILETSPSGPSSSATQGQSDLQTHVGRRAADWRRERNPLPDRDNDADVSKCGCMWFIT